MSSPSVSIFTSGLLCVKNDLDAASDGGQRFLEDRDLVVSRHLAPGELQLFLGDKRPGVRINQATSAPHDVPTAS